MYDNEIRAMPAKVLIVEDEKLVAADVEQQLQTLGYEVPAIASSGEEAITAATSAPPDLVLMDIHLQGRLDGIEMARILRTRLNVPVVFVTAYADERTIERAKATEPYGYVVKPFSKRELQTAIELALHKHGADRRVRTNEQWLGALVGSLGAGVMVVDHNGSVCLMNPKAERITGARLSDALGASWTDVVRFDPAFEAMVMKAMRDRTETDLNEIEAMFPAHGRKAIISGAITPAAAGGGQTGAVLVFQDTTAARALEYQNRRTRHMEGMQRLAGVVAHNLSNHLTVITGYTESLLRGIDNRDPRSADLRMIEKASEQAAELTRQLFAFSRSENARRREIDINAVVRGMTEALRQTAGPDITLVQSLGPIAVVEADPSHVEEILTALVRNAREAMPTGGTVTIETSHFDIGPELAPEFVDLPPGTYARIDVVDTGVGIDGDTQGRVFEPFFTTKPRGKATGLGLAVTYGLVKQNHGHIWFESEPGRGARFSFCLPLAHQALQENTPIPGWLHGSERVLLLEDDPEQRGWVRNVLTNLGYDVIEDSEEEALSRAEADEGVRVIVLNAIAPGATGMALAHRIASARPDIRFVFTSQFSAEALRAHGALAYSGPVLHKPFSVEDLARAMRLAIEGKEVSLDSDGTGPRALH